MRPRITKDAAIVRLANRLDVPEALCRRHKAGVERLIAALAGEYLDQRKLRDFSELIATEPWAGSRPLIIGSWTS